MTAELKKQTAQMLTSIWRGIPADYKNRYRSNIWQQFQDQIQSAAYTNSLAKFVNTICTRMSASVGTRAEERVEAEALLNSGYDREVLRLLREETVLLVLMVRLEMQRRHLEYEEMNNPDLDKEWE